MAAGRVILEKEGGGAKESERGIVVGSVSISINIDILLMNAHYSLTTLSHHIIKGRRGKCLTMVYKVSRESRIIINSFDYNICHTDKDKQIP